jgi:hypothetical protein
VLRKSSTLGLDELGHALASPSPEPEPDIAALTSAPSTPTIVESSLPRENPAPSGAERDALVVGPNNGNKSGTDELAPKILTGELKRPFIRCD